MMTTWGELAGLAEELAAETGRLKKRAAIVAAVGRALAGSGGEDAGLLCQFLAGRPFAEADARKLNTGGALLTRAVKAVSGCADAELAVAYRRHGDLGAAAAGIWKSVEGGMLTLREVEAAFAGMAAARTTAARVALLEALLRRCSALEAKYLVKLMLGDMRIGVKQSLVEEAIAVVAGAEPEAVRHAVMLEADLVRVAAMAFAGTLCDARMRLFHPLGFMLASPVESAEEAVERFADPKAADGDLPVVSSMLEDKFDGMRAQVHCGDGTRAGCVAIYSRSREEITENFPELVEAFGRVDGGGVILDGEILGWDVARNRALPFAQLGQRIGRKRVDSAMRQQVPLVFMAFDLLFAEGELLLGLPLRERRARLESWVGSMQHRVESPLEAVLQTAQGRLFAAEAESRAVSRLMISPVVAVEDAEQIDRAYKEARERGNEGVMIKSADSVYQPGRRGLAWVKLKRELATLDVVITGAEYGHGRRAGLLSDYTFAVRGPGSPAELLNVGKAYSGVTDAEIAELTAWLKEHTLEDFGHFRTVEPLRVLEVAFNNVMRSDRYTSGFALRFPRILKVRVDKPIEEIDTLETVESIFQQQPDKQEPGGPGSDEVTSEAQRGTGDDGSGVSG